MSQEKIESESAACLRSRRGQKQTDNGRGEKGSDETHPDHNQMNRLRDRMQLETHCGHDQANLSPGNHANAHAQGVPPARGKKTNCQQKACLNGSPADKD